METDNKSTTETSRYDKYSHNNRSGRAMAGIVIIAIGSLFLGRELGAEIPEWIFSWPMFFIAFGIFVGAKHSFRGFGWLIPIAIGALLLADKFFFFNIELGRLIWPLLIILFGLMMIFRPRRRHRRWDRSRWEQRFGEWEKRHEGNAEQSTENYMDSVTVFGSLKKNIIAKDFKGGESTTVFGGTELNFMQADINGRVTIDLTQVFGGTKIIVPANWNIHSEDMVSVFGGLEDKRPIRSDIADPNKVLVLKGTCFFGGIDIKSY